MKHHHGFILRPEFVFWLLLAAVGCQSEAEQLPEVAVSVPDKFEQDGTSWQKRSEVQPSDNDCLAKFFARKQGLVGSPEFDGQPTVFASGRGDRRFYWLRSAVDGVLWRCIEFRNHRFSVIDGSGNPFH